MDNDNKTTSVSSDSPSPVDVQMNSIDLHQQNSTSNLRKRNQFSIDYILSANSAAALVAKQHQDQMAFVDQLNLMNQQRAQLVAAAAAAAAAAATSVEKTTTISQSDDSSDANKLEEQRQLAIQLQNYQQQQANNNNNKNIDQQQQQQQAHPNFLYFMACMLLQQQQQQALANQQQLSNSLQSINVSTQVTSARSPTRESLAILAQLSGATSTTAANIEQHSATSFANYTAQPTSNAAALTDTNLHPTTKSLRHANPYAQLIQQQQQQQSANNLHRQPSYSPLLSSLASNVNGDPKRPMSLAHHHSHRGDTPMSTIQQQQQQQQRHLDQVKSLDRSFHRQANNGTTAPTPGVANTTTTANNTRHFQIGSSNGAAGEKLDNLKPAHSYIGLIGMCILSSPEKRMVLNDVYQFILDHYPYYRNRGSGWRNSVRHNLSLNECFQKAGRAANGKGHYWTIHPANMEDFMNGDFRRRRAQRKVRRWNNMDVPSDESDDESMEDATRPPLPEHFKRSIEMHRRLELSFKQQQQQQQQAVATGLNLNNILPLAGSPFSPLYSQPTVATAARQADLS